MGEPIEVVSDRHGELIVRGLVNTLERKRQITEALAELGHPNWLKLEFRTVSEMSQTTAKRTRTYGPGDDSTTGVAMPSDPTGEVPGLASLIRYLEGQRGGGRTGAPDRRNDVRQQTAQFSNRAVSLSESILGEAWALRRLAERFSSTSGMTPQSRWLLQQMVRDHLGGLRMQVAATRSLLSPIWISGPAVGPPGWSDWSDTGWNATAMHAFRNAERIHAAMNRLFTGTAGNSDAGAEPIGAGAQGAESSDAMAARVIGELTSFERQIERAESAVSTNFSEKGERAALKE
jgi:hypothetical protein